jgi:solute carrier family 41
MNLAARFSTSANIGELDLRLTRRSLILGNLALLQVQALIVSLISGLLSFLLGLLSRRGVHHALQHPVYNPNNGGVDESLRGGYFEALLVLCVSMLAASISSGVLGSFMCSLVVLCRRYKVNPGQSSSAQLVRGLSEADTSRSTDNIATPLASALGDMVTLVILGVLSSIFAKFMGRSS